MSSVRSLGHILHTANTTTNLMWTVTKQTYIYIHIQVERFIQHFLNLTYVQTISDFQYFLSMIFIDFDWNSWKYFSIVFLTFFTDRLVLSFRFVLQNLGVYGNTLVMFVFQNCFTITTDIVISEKDAQFHVSIYRGNKLKFITGINQIDILLWFPFNRVSVLRIKSILTSSELKII